MIKFASLYGFFSEQVIMAKPNLGEGRKFNENRIYDNRQEAQDQDLCGFLKHCGGGDDKIRRS